MKKNLSLILLGLILGIGVFINFENLNIFKLGLVSLSLAFVVYRKNRDFSLAVLAIFLGFTLSFIRLSSFNLHESDMENVQVKILEKRKSNNSYRYTVHIKNKTYDQKAFIFDEGDFDIGDIMDLEGELKLINRNTNPNLFNFRSYAISKNVSLEFKPKNLHQEILRSQSKNIFLKIRKEFFYYINRIFSNNLSKKSSDFVISLLLTDNLIDRESLGKMGLAHILAVSGLHMDMLMTFLSFVGLKLKIPYKYTRIIGLSLVGLYAYIIGFPYSVQRVLIINLIGFVGFLSRKPIDRVKSLIIAALIILLINPFALLSSGFILSFVACLAIYRIYPRFKKLFKGGFIRDSFAFTSAIQLSTLPFVAYYFRYYNLLSIPANFLIVPIFEIAIYLMFFIIFTYPILGRVLKLAFLGLDLLVRSMLNMTSFLGSISFLSLDFVAENILVSIFLFILIYIFANVKVKKNFGKFLGLSLAITSMSLVMDFINKDITYQMIDIGQGDAFLIDDRGKYYMIDVGGPKYKDYDSGERILVPYLKSIGVKEIEGVFISHEDKDHAGNLNYLLENIRVKNIIVDKSLSKEFKDKYQAKIINIGDEVKLSDGFIRCIYDGENNENENDKSMGLLINIKGKTILSLGDLSAEFENKLDQRADILKLSHHGSRSSSSKEFIDRVDPDIALISAGRNNTYGHPNREVLHNIRGIKTYNTQSDGLVKIRVKNKEIKVEKYLKGGFFR